MSLPAVIRPLFPSTANWLETRKQQPQQGSQSLPVERPRQTFDVERVESSVGSSERQLYLEVGRLQGRNEILERARQEDRVLFREFADRAEAIHEGYARRRQETAQGYMSLRHKMARWKYKAKRAGIKYGTLAVVCIVLGMIVYSHFSPDEHPRPHYQNAVDR